MVSSKGERQAVGIRKCHQCGQTGHIARDCRNRFRQQKEQQQKIEGLRCFNCMQRGHIAKNCPHQVMYCKENKTESCLICEERGAYNQGLWKVGRLQTYF